MIVLAVAFVIFAVSFVAGWIRSDAVTNDHQLAGAVSVFGLGGLVLTTTFLTVGSMVTY